MYLKWKGQKITDFSDQNINSLYNKGFLFGRTGKGEMNQTRSIRIDLSKFKLSSENKRVLKKTDSLQLIAYSLPLANYHWQVGKLAKDFYDTKFGKGTFSANKVKELMTDKEKSNFNLLFIYSVILSPSTSLGINSAKNPLVKQGDPSSRLDVGTQDDNGRQPAGYCICLETNEILHYCYPFYSLLLTPYSLPNTGLGMMLKAILWAQKNGKKYIYLGSYQRPTDIYKLQFEGLEWFDGKGWKDDLAELKNCFK